MVKGINPAVVYFYWKLCVHTGSTR